MTLSVYSVSWTTDQLLEQAYNFTLYWTVVHWSRTCGLESLSAQNQRRSAAVGMRLRRDTDVLSTSRLVTKSKAVRLR